MTPKVVLGEFVDIRQVRGEGEDIWTVSGGREGGERGRGREEEGEGSDSRGPDSQEGLKSDPQKRLAHTF